MIRPTPASPSPGLGAALDAAAQNHTIVVMDAIMTVTGVDHTGIVAAVANALAEEEVNIVNISQTLMDQYFTMILHCEFDADRLPISALQERMGKVAEAENLIIKVQSEAIFDAMHEV